MNVHNERFQLNYSRFNSTFRKTIITTEVLSFLSVEKNIDHFHLISFTGLTLRTETNDNHCKLEKTSAFRPLGLLLLYTFKNMKVSVNVLLEIVTLKPGFYMIVRIFSIVPVVSKKF